MKYYCPKCFYKIEYKFNRPEKCPKCSYDFATASRIQKSSDVKVPLQKKPEELEQDRLRQIERKKLEKRIQIAEHLEAKRFLDNNLEDAEASEEEFDDEFDTNYEWRPGLSRLKRNPGISVEIKKEESVSLGSIMQSSNSSVDNSFKELKRQPTGLTKEQILEEIKKESSSAANIINID